MFVIVGVGARVRVRDGVGVIVGVRVIVGAIVIVGVRDGVGVIDGVGVLVMVGVAVGVGVSDVALRLNVNGSLVGSSLDIDTKAEDVGEVG